MNNVIINAPSIAWAHPVASLPRVVDNTMLAAFRTCQHKMFWAHAIGLAPAETNVNLHAGSCFAKAIETLYRSIYTLGESQDRALARASVAFDLMWGDFVPKVDTYKTKLNVWSAVLAYLDEYNPPNDYITPSARFPDPFEYTFCIPLTQETIGWPVPCHPLYDEPFLYGGRFDMLGEQDGFLRIRDDKTTSRLGSQWSNQWTLSSQLMGYCSSMEVLGYPVDTVELRGVGILKYGTTFARAVKSYTNQQLSRWRWQIAQDLKNLVHAVTHNEWEYNFGDACNSYGGCAFMDLCRANDPTVYFDSYTHRRWNPLERPTERNETINV